MFSLEDLLARHPRNIIFRCIGGSRLYGTHSETSDIDGRGIYMLPASSYLSLEAHPNQVSDQKGDCVFYSLRRFLELAINANPNVLELLFVPEDCLISTTAYMAKLVEQRQLFINKKVFESHVGYAKAQIKKARGRNKWINNPQPEETPQKSSFCWFIGLEKGGKKFRPRSIDQTDVDLGRCHAVRVAHAKGLYRLYDLGDQARGVFRNESLVSETVDLADEHRCIGLLVYQDEAYDRAKKDHRHYWHWRKERNESRWLDQEQGAIDYDAKNMMHTFRLLISGRNLLQEGKPLVRFEGEQLQFLKQIRSGHWSYEDLIDRAEGEMSDLESLHEKSQLPESSDLELVDKLLFEITEAWENDHAE